LIAEAVTILGYPIPTFSVELTIFSSPPHSNVCILAPRDEANPPPRPVSRSGPVGLLDSAHTASGGGRRPRSRPGARASHAAHRGARAAKCHARQPVAGPPGQRR